MRESQYLAKKDGRERASQVKKTFTTDGVSKRPKWSVNRHKFTYGDRQLMLTTQKIVSQQ